MQTEVKEKTSRVQFFYVGKTIISKTAFVIISFASAGVPAVSHDLIAQVLALERSAERSAVKVAMPFVIRISVLFVVNAAVRFAV